MIGDITGTLTITDPAIPFTKWRVMATEAKQTNNWDSITVETEGDTPAPYTIRTWGKSFPVYITVNPYIDAVWETSMKYNMGTLVLPRNNSVPYLFELTGIEPEMLDPHRALVVSKVSFEAGLSDEIANTVTVGAPAPSILPYAASTPPDENWNRLGLGYASFQPVNLVGPVHISDERLDLGTGDFTIEFWASCWANDAQGTLFCYGDPASPNALKVTMSRNIPATVTLGGFQIGQKTGWATDWRRFVFTREEGTFRGFFDGQLFMAVELENSISGPIYLGSLPGVTPATHNGYCFDWCVTKGLARQTANLALWKRRSLGWSIVKTGQTEPNWPTTPGQTVYDNGCIWSCKGRMVRPVTEGPFWGPVV